MLRGLEDLGLTPFISNPITCVTILPATIGLHAYGTIENYGVNITGLFFSLTKIVTRGTDPHSDQTKICAPQHHKADNDRKRLLV